MISFNPGDRSGTPAVMIPRTCMFTRLAYPSAENSSHSLPFHICSQIRGVVTQGWI